MQKRRLLKLARLLDAHRDNGVRFDLGTWQQTDTIELDGNGAWCGTKACAVGLACCDKAFNKSGLELVMDVPYYGSMIGYCAVRDFFGLEHSDQARYLFSPDYYTGKVTGNAAARKVARRIRKVVERGFPTKVALERHWEKCEAARDNISW